MFEVIEMRCVSSAVDPCENFFVVEGQSVGKRCQQRGWHEQEFEWCQETELLGNGIDSEEEVDCPDRIKKRCIFHCMLLVQQLWYSCGQCDLGNKAHLLVCICFISRLYAISADTSRASQSVH